MAAPLRPLRPLLPGDPERQVPTHAPPKRRIKIACQQCSQKKCRASLSLAATATISNTAHQCDGDRPTCFTCKGLSIECAYDVAEGQSRHRSLKVKHEALRRDLGGTLEVLWHIQHGTDTDAQAMFSRLREGVNPSAILATVRPVGTATQQQSLSTVSATGVHSHGQYPHAPQLAGQTTLHNLTGIPDLSDSAPLTAILRSQGDVLTHAFSIFLKCTSSIFHVYTQNEVDALLTKSLQSDGQVPLSTLCEACAIAAVGSRFSRSRISPELGEYYSSLTKQLLDECIEKTPLQAIKVCALLAMCNIINKATAAFAYVELGLGVASINGLLERKPHSHLDHSTWLESKKVARSLILCRGWLQATLSYVPETETPVRLSHVDGGDECCLDCEDQTLYQTQVARLTVIKAGIFQQMESTDFSPESSEAIRLLLRQWLDQVPEHIRLENLEKSTVSPEAHISGLYLHSFYLGGRMLVYRWILSWIIQKRRAREDVPPETNREAARCAEEGMIAAQESAVTISKVWREGGAVRHCWLCIFQAYLSCCMLLYDIVQRAIHGQQIAHLNNLELASRALEVLAWTGQLDATGKQYHASLSPIFTLASNLSVQSRESSLHPSNEHVHFRETHGTSPLNDAAHTLSQMLYIALNPEQERGRTASVYRPTLDESITSFDEVGLGVHLYWAMEFRADGQNPTDHGDTNSHASRYSLLPHLRGHFAGGTQPSGWTISKSFVDPVLTDVSTTDVLASHSAL